MKHCNVLPVDCCGHSYFNETLKKKEVGDLPRAVLLGALLGHLVHPPEGQGLDSIATLQGLFGHRVTSMVPHSANVVILKKLIPRPAWGRENPGPSARPPFRTYFQAFAGRGQY